MTKEPEFTFGIEEEYLLVDPHTMSLAADPPEAMFEMAEAGAKAIPGAVSRELIRAQIEIATAVLRSQDEAHTQLYAWRRLVVEAAEAHGLNLLACSAHPFAWAEDQQHTNQRRYREIKDDLQFAARRLMVCGMHVHIGIDDPQMRLDVLNGLREYLPLLLALTASSPFWEGSKTGLKSVRPVIIDELPRSGLPDRFATYAAYESAVKNLVDAGVIEDASKIWWDARLSAKWPTLEIRIMDVCPCIEDALALAAFARCLCRMLWRRMADGQKITSAPRLAVMENRWRAQRFGAAATLLDHRKGVLTPVSAWLDELLPLIAADAQALGCEAQIDRVRRIAQRGSSADRQLASYDSAISRGDGEEKALKGLAEALVSETKAGLELQANPS